MKNITKVSYFPGCSLKSSSSNSNYSLVSFLKKAGVEVEELENWNCCGSSSVKGVDPQLADRLAARNLSLAPKGVPLLSPCPGCFQKLKSKHVEYRSNPIKREKFKREWGREFDPGLNILSFFDLVPEILQNSEMKNKNDLKGLRIVPYYGCMLSKPQSLKEGSSFYGVMEKIIASLGAVPVDWGHSSRCCGTYLSATNPKIVEKSVEKIMSGAELAKADCIVTACSMCQLNLEMRSTLTKIPVLFLSDLISLALGTPVKENWLSGHLVDPCPALGKRGIICSQCL
jgi:heterodisulfide reductase subunit B